MKKHALSSFLLLSALLVAGCGGYKAYMGLHGPSIRNTPDVHENVSLDQECLECHHPDRETDAPKPRHYKFTGCLKCHNEA
ncbi:MAG: hypothetical protein KJ737_21415 [Proteobacteria bacterium]|nr:hypothetical protein [Pseudomonadota bacterium]